MDPGYSGGTEQSVRVGLYKQYKTHQSTGVAEAEAEAIPSEGRTVAKKIRAPRRARTANKNTAEFARLALELAVTSPQRFRAVLEDMRREIDSVRDIRTK